MRVFIAFYGGGQVSAALPVIAGLKKRGTDVIPLALTAASAMLRRHGIPHRRMTDYVPDYVDVSVPEIRRFGDMLIPQHHTDGKGISIDESYAYLGGSLRDLAAELGEEEALRRYRASGLNSLRPTALASDILSREEPDWVIATASPRMESAMLLAAHRLGLPSLCMIDLFAILELPWLRDRYNGHIQTVYAPKIAERLVAAGRDPNTIFVTGNPAFDHLASPDLPDLARAWRRAHGIAEDERVILWAEQPEPNDPELPRRIRRHLAEICATRPGWRLVVRLHPSSTDPRGKVIPEGALQSTAEEDLPVVAAGSDCVVTLTSTVAMEMLLLGKPAILLKMSQYDDLPSYSEADGALVLNDLAEVERGLNELLQWSPLAERLAQARKILQEVGRAAARICDLLEQRRDFVLQLIENGRVEGRG